MAAVSSQFGVRIGGGGGLPPAVDEGTRGFEVDVEHGEDGEDVSPGSGVAAGFDFLDDFAAHISHGGEFDLGEASLAAVKVDDTCEIQHGKMLLVGGNMRWFWRNAREEVAKVVRFASYRGL